MWLSVLLLKKKHFIYIIPCNVLFLFPVSKKKRKNSKTTRKAKRKQESPEAGDRLPKDYNEWKQQRLQLNKYFHIFPQKQDMQKDTPHMLLMDTTLRSGKKFVQLLHQTSDTNVQIPSSSKCQSDYHGSLFKAIERKPQTKAVKVSCTFDKSSHSADVNVSTVAVDNTVVDKTTRTNATKAANQNSTANLTQDSTPETDRDQVTDEHYTINQTENSNVSKEVAIPPLPTNVDQNEATHNNDTQLVANETEVNNIQPMIIENPKTTQYEQNHLVADQLPNVGQSTKTPPWIKQNQVGSSTESKMLLNIVPLQGTATSLDENQTVINQPPTPSFLRLEINRTNGNIQPNIVQPAVVNFQTPVPTTYSINQCGYQVQQPMIMIQPNENFLFPQPNHNLDHNQNMELNNLGQNINDSQNQNVNNNQIERMEENSLKRKRPESPVFKEPLSKILNRMGNSNYDANWFKKMFGNLYKPKRKVKEGKTKDNNVQSRVVETDRSMPRIQNVISLAQSCVSNETVRNNNNVVSLKFRNIASKPTPPMVIQTAIHSTSGENIQKNNFVHVKQGVIHDQHTQAEQIKIPKSTCINEKKTQGGLPITQKHNTSIVTKNNKGFIAQQNVENPQRSIIQHTSTIVSHQKAETKQINTVLTALPQKIKQTQKNIDAIETAQKSSVINTTPAIHTENQIIIKAQNDRNLRGSELPVLSVKSTDTGAGNYVENTILLFNILKLLKLVF